MRRCTVRGYSDFLYPKAAECRPESIPAERRIVLKNRIWKRTVSAAAGICTAFCMVLPPLSVQAQEMTGELPPWEIEGNDYELGWGEAENFGYPIRQEPMTRSALTGGALTPNGAEVTGIRVLSVVDGTEPFDEDDDPGNDSGSENGIVRSFDSVNYTLAYTMGLHETDFDYFTEGDVWCRFELPVSASEAVFDVDAMAWMVDPQLETQPDRTILTCRRHVDCGDYTSAIPGAGTLSVIVKVQGMANGSEIIPEFSMWMDGNPEDCIRTLEADPLTVSAAPRYNIGIFPSQYQSPAGTYDLTSGEAAPGGQGGKIYSAGLVVQLKNDRVEKGLRGLELPQGDITFDLEMHAWEQIYGGEIEERDTPILWDYKTNDTVRRRGVLDRNLIIGNETELPYSASVPLDIGTDDRSCTDSGTWRIEQEGNILHVTVSNYRFSEDYRFPTLPGLYDAATGCFSAGYVQILCPADSADEVDADYYLTVSDQNLCASSISGQTLSPSAGNDNQMDQDDDSMTTQGQYHDGIFGKEQQFFKSFEGLPQGDANIFASTWEGGDGSAWRGTELLLGSCMGLYSNEVVPYSFNMLQKFDDEGFEISAEDGEDDFQMSLTGTSNMQIRVLYGAKPDGTGWKDDAEMDETAEEELVYYRDMASLLADQKTCVAVLYEGRNGTIHPDYRLGQYMIQLWMFKDMKIREDAVPHGVYQTVNSLKVWDESGQLDDTQTRLNPDASYPEPFAYRRNGVENSWYQKAAYHADGSLMEGSHAGGYLSGNSMRIAQFEASVSNVIADLDADGNPKDSYDVGAGQNQVTYALTPQVRTPDTAAEKTTPVTITSRLPVNLTYIQGSASRDGVPMEPEITQSEDGSQTLVWHLDKEPVNEETSPILFGARIGNMEDPENDVRNGDILTQTADIQTDEDPVKISELFGNRASVGLKVIKLTDVRILKNIEEDLVEQDAPVTFTLECSNTSHNPVENLAAMDILPYAEDGRESDYEGIYGVTELLMDTAHCPNSELSVYYTTQEEIRGKDASEFQAENGIWKEASRTDTGEGVLFHIPQTPQETVKAVVLAGTLAPLEMTKLTWQLQPDGNEGGDCYGNHATLFVPGLPDVVETIPVRARVIGRRLSGLAWEDSDRDGRRDADEVPLAGVKVSLTDQDGNEVTDVHGRTAEPVITDEDGAYVFDDLKDEVYTVHFNGTDDFKINDWELTKQQVSGVSEEENSDARPCFDSGNTFYEAQIPGLEFEDPTIERPFVEITHQDAGFWKKDPDTNPPEDEEENNPCDPQPDHQDNNNQQGQNNNQNQNNQNANDNSSNNSNQNSNDNSSASSSSNDNSNDNSGNSSIVNNINMPKTCSTDKTGSDKTTGGTGTDPSPIKTSGYTSSGKTASAGSNPKTGDDAPVPALAAGASSSLAGIGYLLFRRSRQRRKFR